MEQSVHRMKLQIWHLRCFDVGAFFRPHLLRRGLLGLNWDTERKRRLTRICHMTSVHAPDDDRIAHKECVSLVNAGYEVSLVYLGTCREKVDERIHYVCAGEQSVGRLCRMSAGVWKVFWAAWHLHADVYHFHDPELILAGIVLRLSGKKVIYDVHEDVPKQIMSKEWIPKRLRKGISMMVALLERVAIPSFNGIVVVHEDLLKRISKYHSRVVVIHNYPIYLYEDLPSTRKMEFVWLGGLGRIRGDKELNQAFQEEGTLHIIGDVENKEIFTGNNHVILEGSFSMRDAQIRASKFFCGLVTFLPVPNHIHAIPIKMFEYMSLGMAVIASDFPLWREIIGKIGCGILVNPQEPNEIVNAVRWMQAHPQEARKMGDRGLEAVKGDYNWKHEERILLDFYQEIIR